MTDSGLAITRAVDLQIVNGGQTTASLFHTEAGQGRSFPDIRPVEAVCHRQPTERNGRSKDIGVCEHPEPGECRRLLSNHPFHVRMEGFS